MTGNGTELRRRGFPSQEAKSQFQPQPPLPCHSSAGFKFQQKNRGRPVRVGLQLPTNYVLKGCGNAYWNKNFSVKVSLEQRRSRGRKRLPPEASDPLLHQRQQQMLLMQQQQQMMMWQAQREALANDDGDSSDGSSCSRKKAKSGMQQKAKAVFAFLMLPSIVMLFNSHKKINKEESNVDLSALRAGGFGGMGGMGGMGGGGGGAAGIPGMGGMGPGAAGGRYPGMGRGMGDQEVPGAMPGRHPAQGEKESSDEYVRRLMSMYNQKGADDPHSEAPDEHDDYDAEAKEMDRDPFDAADHAMDDPGPGMDAGLDSYDGDPQQQGHPEKAEEVEAEAAERDSGLQDLQSHEAVSGGRDQPEGAAGLPVDENQEKEESSSDEG